MTLLSDALAATKKILLVSEELDRISADIESIAHTVTDHEHRLIRIETIIEITRPTTRRTLPGK
jgi:hypothetical protein